ncbi:hypothetical protein SCHPADRAFT_893754 [Schizopora paradoxa]|uniref:Uncharacterized protein n=1 Tax=Schizopora paradoxa TaxID=27342 RepID=A0A0H2RUY0_9AGAM|nr:hypothetical protein SCHPADRAFT_893754 [Schizopora paradoxa]
MSIDQHEALVRFDTSSSTTHSTATASDIVGPGRTLGNFIGRIGKGLESLLDKCAIRLHLGPEAVARDIRRIRRHEQISFLVRFFVPYAHLTSTQDKKIRKLCKRLLKYARSHVRATQLKALEEIISLSIEDRLVRNILLNFNIGKLAPNYKESDLFNSISKAIVCVEETETHELWSSYHVLAECMDWRGPALPYSILDPLKKSLRHFCRIANEYCTIIITGAYFEDLWEHYLEIIAAHPSSIEWCNVNEFIGAFMHSESLLRPNRETEPARILQLLFVARKGGLLYKYPKQQYLGIILLHGESFGMSRRRPDLYTRLFFNQTYGVTSTSSYWEGRLSNGCKEDRALAIFLIVTVCTFSRYYKLAFEFKIPTNITESLSAGDIEQIDVLELSKSKFLPLKHTKPKTPLSLTGHFPIMAFQRESEEPSYLAIIYNRRTSFPKYIATVKEGNSAAIYHDEDGKLQATHIFEVLVLRHEPVDLHTHSRASQWIEFQPCAGSLDPTGTVFWLQYFPKKDPDFFEDAEVFLRSTLRRASEERSHSSEVIALLKSILSLGCAPESRDETDSITSDGDLEEVEFSSEAGSLEDTDSDSDPYWSGGNNTPNGNGNRADTQFKRDTSETSCSIHEITDNPSFSPAHDVSESFLGYSNEFVGAAEVPTADPVLTEECRTEESVPEPLLKQALKIEMEDLELERREIANEKKIRELQRRELEAEKREIEIEKRDREIRKLLSMPSRTNATLEILHFTFALDRAGKSKFHRTLNSYCEVNKPLNATTCIFGYNIFESALIYKAQLLSPQNRPTPGDVLRESLWAAGKERFTIRVFWRTTFRQPDLRRIYSLKIPTLKIAALLSEAAIDLGGLVKNDRSMVERMGPTHRWRREECKARDHACLSVVISIATDTRRALTEKIEVAKRCWGKHWGSMMIDGRDMFVCLLVYGAFTRADELAATLQQNLATRVSRLKFEEELNGATSGRIDGRRRTITTLLGGFDASWPRVWDIALFVKTLGREILLSIELDHWSTSVKDGATSMFISICAFRLLINGSASLPRPCDDLAERTTCYTCVSNIPHILYSPRASWILVKRTGTTPKTNCIDANAFTIQIPSVHSAYSYLVYVRVAAFIAIILEAAQITTCNTSL